MKSKLLIAKRIDAVFQEQKIQLSGCADECLIEVGKILGSSSIIVSVEKWGIILQLICSKNQCNYCKS